MRKVLVPAIAVLAMLGACTSGAGNSGNSAPPARTAAQAELDRAIAAMEARNYKEAENVLAGILARNPNDPYANLNMGVLKAITDDKPSAMQFYKTAIQNGESAPMKTTVTANGTKTVVNTTVAEVARGNVSRL